MNFFEDLVIELKQENLLEDTVMDSAPESVAASNQAANAELPDDAPNAEHSDVEFPPEPHFVLAGLADGFLDEQPSVQRSSVEQMVVPEDSDFSLQGSDENVSIRKPASEREFYKKRATAEVSSLQMVEHILSAIEREYRKRVPAEYDDFEVKKALNNFLQAAEDISTDAHKQTEFALMQETESWCSALAVRDKEISVSDLRRYCENCRPMLSSQAMLALARFYRNLPYSEAVRGKFDFIVTRLFSRPLDDQRRKMLFTQPEMLGHLKTLYAEWSSISLYSANDPDSNVGLTALSFSDLTAEAEAAKDFDELLEADFFNRIRLFKESIAELFYAPEVTAAAIECNIRIGDVYVNLVERERERSDAASVHDKYSYIDDEAISGATGRTMELVDILREKARVYEEPEPEEIEAPVQQTAPKERPVKADKVESQTNSKFAFLKLNLDKLPVNKWLLATGLLLIMASVGLYIWANFALPEAPSSVGVATVNLNDTPFKDDIKLAKLSGDTLYAIVQPAWETMTNQKQQELLQKIYQHGGRKEWSKVNLMNSTGKTVAFMSPSRIEIDGNPPVQ